MATGLGKRKPVKPRFKNRPCATSCGDIGKYIYTSLAPFMFPMLVRVAMSEDNKRAKPTFSIRYYSSRNSLLA